MAVLVLAASLAACGGGDEDAAAVLDAAFATPVESADVAVSAAFETEGDDSGQGPVRAEIAGPYRRGEGDAPASLDWDVTLSGGEGNSLPLGVVSTGDATFVEVAGAPFELPATLPSLELDARSWFVEPEIEGEEEIEGVQTTHVSGSFDVARMLVDLNEALAAAGESLEGQAPTSLTEEQRAQLDEAIEEASFDAYVDEDDVIRRLTASLDLAVPEEDRDQVQGLEGGVLTFSMDLTDVGGDQQIEAPEDPRPFSELVSQLEVLPGLLGGSGLPAPPLEDGDGDGQAVPEGGGAAPGAGVAPGAGATPPEPEVAPGAGATPPGSPDAQAFEAYSQCLAQADASDQAALARCDELLTP